MPEPQRVAGFEKTIMMTSVLSVHHVPIRLTAERWTHVVEEHCELAGLQLEVLETVARPEAIYAGRAEELLAIRELLPGRYLVVVYRETATDGFIVTAFLTSKIQKIQRRPQLWP